MNYKNKIILAPMVAVTNLAFRKLCTDYGADIAYSEMIDSRAFLAGDRKLSDFVDEKNVVAQFLGNDGKDLATCAQAVEGKVKAFDINLGCPHSDVVKSIRGSYLLRYPERIDKMLSILTAKTNLPVTVKIRIGWDKEHLNALDVIKVCEDNGVAAIAVHGRPRTVNYERPVDYELIRKIKNTASVPILGNGDIFDGPSAQKMFDTGVDSIMVARGAIGNPTIFSEIKDYLKGKLKKYDKTKAFFEYLKYCQKYSTDFAVMKRQSQAFTKGLVGGSVARDQMSRADSVDDLKDIFASIQT